MNDTIKAHMHFTCIQLMVALLLLFQKLQMSTDHMIFLHNSSIRSTFTTILFGYKGLLQLIAILLAFRTRNIKVKGLDDAKYIISTVYITTIGIVLIMMASFVLREYLNGYTATVTFSLFFSTGVILGLIFIPKVGQF